MELHQVSLDEGLVKDSSMIDRTPKQKVKLNVTYEKLLNLMLKYNGGKPRAEVRETSAFLSSIFYQSLDSFYIFFFFL